LRWAVDYTDGHTVHEGESSYLNLDRNGLAKLVMYDDSGVKASVSFSEGQQPFMRRRTFNATRPDEFHVWLLGWRTKTETHIIVLHEDGSKEEYNSWGLTPVTYEPEWYPQEQV